MALRARLSPPRPEADRWPWHQATWASIPISAFAQGERRLEAENYLSSGFGLSVAIRAKTAGWSPLKQWAVVSQPSRLKGTLVSPEYGQPYLAATQVFDFRPAPRKWLAIEKIARPEELSVAPGTILVTRSGSVGRAVFAHRPHQQVIISDDLLRLCSRLEGDAGWLYAYLRTSSARALMTASQYGHIIKHLEVSHLNALPVVKASQAVRVQFNRRVRHIYQMRDAAHTLMNEAEAEFHGRVGRPKEASNAWSGFSVRASNMFAKRRRLEGYRYNPTATSIVQQFKATKHIINRLGDLVARVHVPGRFKHVYGEEGVPYLDSADLLEVNPDLTKYVLSLTEEEQKEYKVKASWILLPCSGQVYGNLGSVVVATKWHENKVISNHVMRIVPKRGAEVRIGYLQCALGHPQLGRPLIIRYAFGSSVPELAPEDIADTPVIRLGKRAEDEIADQMEEANSLLSNADLLEEEMAAEAQDIFEAFLHGDASQIDP